jgi:FkbM family methyltransferase
MPDIHTFDNGVKIHRRHLLDVQIERYKQINLHEPEEERWIEKLVEAIGKGRSDDGGDDGGGGGGVFMDVGAAVGYYCFLVHLLDPTIELHAFEPMETNRQHLAQNAKLNGIESINVHPEAVSSRVGSANLAGEHYVARLDPRNPGVTVPTTTIDAFQESLGTPIDLVKIDIQGGETDALMGAVRSLRDRLVRNWIVGTHHPRIHQWCLDAFKHHGLRVLFESQQVAHQPDGLIVTATGKR